jgi:hypothetical protein
MTRQARGLRDEQLEESVKESVNESIQRNIPVRRARTTYFICANALLAAGLLALLAGCGLLGPAAEPTPVFSPITQQSPVASSGMLIVQTLTSFCSAVHSGNLDQAYTYLSSTYKRTVTSPSQIPTMLGPQVRLTNCTEFGNGDFLKINGTEATDSLVVTVYFVQLGSSSQGGGSMSFVQEGSAWLIDGITGV